MTLGQKESNCKASGLARSTRWEQVLFWSMAGFVFSLPLFEAPKNIFWAFMVIAWLGCLAMKRLDIQPDILDKVVALYVIGWCTLTALDYFMGYPLGRINDLIRYGMAFFVFRHNRLTVRQQKFLIWTLIASTVTGLLWGYYRRDILHVAPWPMYQSIGGIGGAVAYTLLVAVFLLQLLVGCHTRFGRLERVVLGLALSGAVYSIFQMESRAGVLSLMVAIGMTIIAWLKTHRRAVGYLVVALGVVSVFMVADPPRVWEKHVLKSRHFETNVDIPRLKGWHTSLIAWRTSPLTGFGSGNYYMVNPENVRRWVIKTGKAYNAGDYFFLGDDAHNLLVNWLVEGGVIGLVLGFVMLGGAFWMCWPRKDDPPAIQVRRRMALVILVAYLSNSVTNMTLMFEVACLFMALMGMIVPGTYPAQEGLPDQQEGGKYG